MVWFKRFVLIAGSVVLAICCVLAVYLRRELAAPRATSKQIDELQVQGELILDQISAFRFRYQRVPETFEEAGICPKQTLFGDWEFRYAAPSYFEIWVGDYDRNGFCLDWDSSRGEWYRDT